MSVGDEVTLRIVGRYQDQNIVNTLHYVIDQQAAGEQEILQNLCSNWISQHESDWVGRHSEDYTLVGVKAFAHGGAPKVPGYLASATPGIVVGSPLPATVCRTITLYTDAINRKRRGRIMLSGTVADMIDEGDGSVTATERSLCQTLGDGLQAPLSSAGDEFALILPSKGELDLERIVHTMARYTPASLRSRRIKQFLIG